MIPNEIQYNQSYGFTIDDGHSATSKPVSTPVSNQHSLIALDEGSADKLEQQLNDILQNKGYALKHPIIDNTGNAIGYEVSISMNDDGIALKNDKNGLQILNSKGDLLGQVAPEDTQKLVAVGDEEASAIRYSDELIQKSERNNREAKWGELSSYFEDSIHSESDLWKPGNDIKMNAKTHETLEKSIQAAQSALTSANKKSEHASAAIETTMLEFAAEKGMLDDGTLSEEDAQAIAEFAATEEFKNKINHRAGLKDFINDKANASTIDDVTIDSLLKEGDNAAELKMLNGHDDNIDRYSGDPEKNQQFYKDNKDEFSNLFKQWGTLTQGQEMFSRAQIQAFAKSNNPDTARAAQFLLDNPEVYDQMDLSGDRPEGAIAVTDGIIGTDSLKNWMKHNGIFGTEFQQQHSSALQYIKESGSQWLDANGNIDRQKLEEIANQPLQEMVSEDDYDGDGEKNFRDFDDPRKAVEAAKFLLENEDFVQFSTINAGSKPQEDQFNLTSIILSDSDIGSAARQGKGNNCFAIAGLSSLAQSDTGRQLITDSITKTPSGDYEIVFPNDPMQHTYTVTQEELDASEAFRPGTDVDMHVATLAMNKLFQERPEYAVDILAKHYPKDELTEEIYQAKVDEIRENGMEKGGSTLMVYNLFSEDTGEVSSVVTDAPLGTPSPGGERRGTEVPFDWFKMNAEDINNHELSVSIGTSVNSETLLPESGKGGVPHAIYIESVNPEEGTLTIRNPWNTGMELTLTQKQYEEFTRSQTYTVTTARL